MKKDWVSLWFWLFTFAVVGFLFNMLAVGASRAVNGPESIATLFVMVLALADVVGVYVLVTKGRHMEDPRLIFWFVMLLFRLSLIFQGILSHDWFVLSVSKGGMMVIAIAGAIALVMSEVFLADIIQVVFGHERR